MIIWKLDRYCKSGIGKDVFFFFFLSQCCCSAETELLLRKSNLPAFHSLSRLAFTVTCRLLLRFCILHRPLIHHSCQCDQFPKFCSPHLISSPGFLVFPSCTSHPLATPSKSSLHGTAPISSPTIAAISLLTSTCLPPPSFPSLQAFRVNDTDRCSLQPFLKALTHNQRPLHSAAGLSSPRSVSRSHTKNPLNTHVRTHVHTHIHILNTSPFCPLSAQDWTGAGRYDEGSTSPLIVWLVRIDR